MDGKTDVTVKGPGRDAPWRTQGNKVKKRPRERQVVLGTSARAQARWRDFSYTHGNVRRTGRPAGAPYHTEGDRAHGVAAPRQGGL